MTSARQESEQFHGGSAHRGKSHSREAPALVLLQTDGYRLRTKDLLAMFAAGGRSLTQTVIVASR